MSSSAAGDDKESAAAARVPTEEKEEEADSSSTRICSHCGKRFESGKALGGHMRIHRISKSKKLPTSGDEFSCEICGKNFESRRSVYGHMRAHPQREWRGMHPAADQVSSANSLSSTVSDSHNQVHDSAATDLTKYLSFWSVTGKRGRKGKRNDDPVSENAPKSPEPRSRPFKKKMRKLSDLELANYRHGGGSFNNWPETESATTNSSVTNSTKNDVIRCKNSSDNKEILTACCREEVNDHYSAGHGGRKLLQIDLNELPTMEKQEEDEDEDEGIY